MKYVLRSLPLVLFAALVGVTIAQEVEDCPAIVQAALTATNDACQDTRRNQACYGSVRLQATPQDGITAFTFDQQGDKVEVASIKSLTLSSFDAKKGEWGVALLRLQANLPDTLPGQNVTILLFGNVQLQNDVSKKSALKPMQAFYFQSGVGDAPCAEAPSSGILIQTPKGAGKVNLTVNGADIALGSTAYLQAQPGKAMTIAVVEGEAQVQAFGTMRVVRPGWRVSIPIDDQNAASGPPQKLERYSRRDVQGLPIRLLEHSVDIPILEQPGDGNNPAASGFDFLEVSECARWRSTLHAGQTVAFQVGFGRFPTVAELNQRARNGASITLDGVSLPVYYEGATIHGPEGYGNRARADWTATSGTHTVVAGWITYSDTFSTCMFTVP